MRLLLTCCLLLQVAAPVWACQHAAATPCHHCCDAADDADGQAPVCLHCAAHGQTWGVGAVPAVPAAVEGDGDWRPSRELAPPPVFADSLFKPPIFLPVV